MTGAVIVIASSLRFTLVITFLVSVDKSLNYYLDVVGVYSHEVKVTWVKHQTQGYVAS